jgi:mannosyltransferase OCH1-like enzyme
MNKNIIILIVLILYIVYIIHYISDEDNYIPTCVNITLYLSYLYNKCFSLKLAKNHNIPKTIWQTYKTKILPNDAIKPQNTWINKNKDWELILYDDNDIENYIEKYWGYRMMDFYKNLIIGAMKADLWRYLILTTHGGVYTDIDTICNRPIDSWIYDLDLKNKKNVLLVSIEPNYLYFCQWTVLSTANHPAMKHISEYVLLNYEKNGINYHDPNFVFNTTGPSIWSNAIINYLKLDHMSVREVYFYYLTNKTEIENKGIYFIPWYSFTITYSVNLAGSSTFGNNYESWKKKSANLIKN